MNSRIVDQGRILYSVFSDCILYSVLCIPLLIIATSCSTEHDVANPQRGGSSQRTYAYGERLDGSINAATLMRLDSSTLIASPLVLGSRTYAIATTHNTLERYDHGARNWSVACGAGTYVRSGMVADAASTVYAALTNGEIVSVNVAGTIVWRMRTPDGAAIVSDLLLTNDRIVAVSASHHVIALSCASGTVAYYTSTSAPLLNACCADAVGNVYVTSADGTPTLSCIDARGTVRWASRLDLAAIRMHPLIASNHVIVGGTSVSGRGAVMAVRTDGTVAWTKDLSAIPQYGSSSGDTLYVVAMERGMLDRPSSHVYAVDGRGKELWNVWYDQGLRSPCYVSTDCMTVCTAPTSTAVWTNVLVLYRNGRIRRLVDLGNEPLTTDLPDVDTDGALVFACADTAALLRIEHKSLTDLLGR